MLRRFCCQFTKQSQFLGLQQCWDGKEIRLESNLTVQNPVRGQNEGYPICVTSFGSFPFSPGVIREDVLRFFDKCKLEGDDVMVQYSPTFRPHCWWVRFHSKEDREIAIKLRTPRWGGRRVVFEEKTMRDWKVGTYNHLIGKILGGAILVTRLAFPTTTEDVASFFRSFHLQGNGVTVLQDPLRPSIDEQDQFKRAIVRLVSKQEAQRAARSLHRRYLRNSLVSLRVLQ